MASFQISTSASLRSSWFKAPRWNCFSTLSARSS
ncbi:Uncharacterised protein [Mycobacterium tuberculosis]|uniref:Uncharacterized protein n=1 Tax=Mycobacterium tuberculosis TaxID=1773 RepID=A0A916L8V5_MYCTX|nr:Uncharacterised protein [Mycobacterium tuberculosis]COX26150.1 Uncharacterised protein [Mycobacterium tuberculosis]